MKVLLVSTNRLATPFPVYPLGLDYVAGAIADRHETATLDLAADRRPAALSTALVELRPDVVGLSIRNVDNTDIAHPAGFLDEVRALARTVRRESRARLVLGGSGFSIFPAELLDAVEADGGIVGEGERLRAVLDAWEQGAPTDGLPGLVVRGNAAVRPGAWGGPPSRRWRPDSPHVGHYLQSGGMLNLQSKRGCPLRCTYCTYPAIEGHEVRVFEPAGVAQTARALQDAGARFLFFTDASFNLDPQHNLAVADALRAAGVSIPWGAFFAPVAPPAGYYQRLAASGLTHVEFGSEALSPTLLASYGKPFGVRDVHAAHAAAQAAGLHAAHYFLLGGPGETESTLRETLDGAERLERAARFFFVSVRIYPGTPLHRRAVEEGQVPAERSLLEPTYYRCGIAAERILERVAERARGRLDWVTGSGGDRMARVVARLHARGATGPLWERLIP